MSHVKICYLCGKEIQKEEHSLDHVPPKQFFPKSLRKQYSPRLIKLSTHKMCNEAYQKDEDYFIHSLGPVAMRTQTGKSLWEDIQRKKRPEDAKIIQMIRSEFRRFGSISLPGGRIAKAFDGNRVRRVVWKITRGLFFTEKSVILPQDVLGEIEIVSLEQRMLPHFFQFVADKPSRGIYPKVFDYKFLEHTTNGHFHIWALFFWEMIVATVAFHDPDCTCEVCVSPKETNP